MEAREIIDEVTHLLGDKAFEKIAAKVDANEEVGADEQKKINR